MELIIIAQHILFYENKVISLVLVHHNTSQKYIEVCGWNITLRKVKRMRKLFWKEYIHFDHLLPEWLKLWKDIDPLSLTQSTQHTFIFNYCWVRAVCWIIKKKLEFFLACRPVLWHSLAVALQMMKPLRNPKSTLRTFPLEFTEVKEDALELIRSSRHFLPNWFGLHNCRQIRFSGWIPSCACTS